METKVLGNYVGRNGILYPMLVIAAIAVIVFSAFGVATMTGLLPRAESMNAAQQPASARASAGSNADKSARIAKSDTTCANCGVVESINAVDVKGGGTGLGVVAGGVTGALLGNQIGRGSGNTVATIAGAAGGAFAGNEIEKNMKKTMRYQVRVRMNDGTYRTTYQSLAPAFGVGEKVKVVNGQIVVG